VLTTSLLPGDDVAEHVRLHGDGVRAIGLAVDNAESAYRETVRRGATKLLEPTVYRDEKGSVRISAIRLYGDTIHTFVERGDYGGSFLPGFVPVQSPRLVNPPAGLKGIDHMVANVPLGEMNRWVRFYEDVMGFRLYQTFDDRDISTEYSALMSKVMAKGDGQIKFPINEPAQGRHKSQIEEYLDFYQGQGIQHIALTTDDIVETVRRMRDQGVEFLCVPKTYYEELSKRVGRIDENIDRLAEFSILVDRDDEGYMLQIFTRPVQDRPTLFYEVIQRKGSRGFGKGNFKALFEAIEREQTLRGNL
jgi:4-hydroxyphenylpyruvate dioxygenase